MVHNTFRFFMGQGGLFLENTLFWNFTHSSLGNVGHHSRARRHSRRSSTQTGNFIAYCYPDGREAEVDVPRELWTARFPELAKKTESAGRDVSSPELTSRCWAKADHFFFPSQYTPSVCVAGFSQYGTNTCFGLPDVGPGRLVLGSAPLNACWGSQRG